MVHHQSRQVIVPCINQVCFYPCCKDVFDIYQTDGISYFLLDKNKKCNIALVSNKCNDITVFNGEEYRSILHEESLLNIGQEIIDSLGTYKVFQFPYITGNKHYEIWMNTKVSGYDWYATQHPRYVLSISRLIDNTKNESYVKGIFFCHIACMMLYFLMSYHKCFFLRKIIFYKG